MGRGRETLGKMWYKDSGTELKGKGEPNERGRSHECLKNRKARLRKKKEREVRLVAGKENRSIKKELVGGGISGFQKMGEKRGKVGGRGEK